MRYRAAEKREIIRLVEQSMMVRSDRRMLRTMFLSTIGRNFIVRPPRRVFPIARA
jgi:hypothetical protein